MTFDNDERIVATEDNQGEKDEFIGERTTLSIINAPEAPLTECKLNVMLELTGHTSDNTSGVDIVTVIDVSGSMYYDGKLEKLKNAMKFVIKKLGPVHRLSVVTFSSNAHLVCPLRQVTDDAQEDIQKLVDELVANGSTNTTAGLEMALQVLRDRRFTRGRSEGIMLMSDGKQNKGKDASSIPGISDVPVFTFGFGKDQEPEVLGSIAEKSSGGTFSDVQNMNDLGKAFSQCLAGLLTLAVKDLRLTLTPESDSKIEKVSAGNYPQSNASTPGGARTVSFGTLYHKEMRKVIVELVLPQVKKRAGKDVLQVSYTYKNESGEEFDSPPVFATVTRTDKITAVQERDEVVVELNRLQTAGMMKEARILADDDKLKDGQEKLLEAQKLLEAAGVQHDLIEMLKYEVEQLYKFMESPEIYEKFGRPFALSSELSHERQRLASRGDVEKLRLFATPIMNAFLQQALEFEKNPNIALPKLEEDVQQARANEPPAPAQKSDFLNNFIKVAIGTVKNITDNIKKH